MHRLLPLILLAGCHALVPLDSPFANEDSTVVDGPEADRQVVDGPVADAPTADDGNLVVSQDATISPDVGSSPFPEDALVVDGSPFRPIDDGSLTGVDTGGTDCLAKGIANWTCVPGTGACTSLCSTIDYWV